ncbi:zinc transporter [Paenibacillus sp. J53TS2]|uniref:CobW family GTP-binding protein n=1 Tax=Paenibacillus sp. J53TS2 TaxID=2807197 RepID=UPI001B2E8694|nr:GTP-binding protein [Paenibacillus sp. J53TS2]GIP46563.1 zinc transporter [Paenibacillus sp. J53TS2]
MTPVYILSGFLGSGKTTLLQRLIRHWMEQGLRPAVIMNEIGEVNLDGLLVSSEVPMAEMLGGCICCTIRGDLSVQMAELIEGEKPDLIVIEATGAGNPMEIFDAVTEVSLYLKLDIKPMVTVVDAAHMADLHASQQGKTYRLMVEQIRCGSVLVLNKIDLLEPDRQREMSEFLRRTNPYARIIPAVKCDVDLSLLWKAADGQNNIDPTTQRGHDHNHDLNEDHRHDHNHDHNDDHNHDHNHAHTHASHEHVTVYTHYFDGPVDSEDFERFIAELPREVYRGKGVLRFTDTASRFLFQYAYREADYLKVTPQGNVPDVAVFIGEHFDRNVIAQQLKELERKQAEPE